MPTIYLTVLYLLAVSCVTDLVTPVLSAEIDLYNSMTNGLLCINSNFTEVRSEAINERLCAYACSWNPRCQAFSTADGPCQLFVFDRCSKSVRDCSCSRRGRVFVKQQQGLQAGQLCPPEFGNDLCGVKYRKFSPGGNWSQGRQKCASESGLVIMADVADATEVDQVKTLVGSIYLWLGGFKAAGSAEPAAGWSWVDCSISGPVGSSLWKSGQPNNNGGNQDAIAMSAGGGLDDREQTFSCDILCECIDPFN